MDEGIRKYFVIGIVLLISIGFLFFMNLGVTGNITGNALVGKTVFESPEGAISFSAIIFIAGFVVLAIAIIMYITQSRDK